MMVATPFEGIPSYSAGVLGSAMCQIVQIIMGYGGISSTDRRFGPTYTPDGQPAMIQVFNLSPVPVAGNAYITIKQNTFGEWIAENPAADPTLSNIAVTQQCNCANCTSCPQVPGCAGCGGRKAPFNYTFQVQTYGLVESNQTLVWISGCHWETPAYSITAQACLPYYGCNPTTTTSTYNPSSTTTTTITSTTTTTTTTTPRPFLTGNYQWTLDSDSTVSILQLNWVSGDDPLGLTTGFVVKYTGNINCQCESAMFLANPELFPNFGPSYPYVNTNTASCLICVKPTDYFPGCCQNCFSLYWPGGGGSCDPNQANEPLSGFACTGTSTQFPMVEHATCPTGGGMLYAFPRGGVGASDASAGNAPGGGCGYVCTGGSPAIIAELADINAAQTLWYSTYNLFGICASNFTGMGWADPGITAASCDTSCVYAQLFQKKGTTRAAILVTVGIDWTCAPGGIGLRSLSILYCQGQFWYESTDCDCSGGTFNLVSQGIISGFYSGVAGGGCAFAYGGCKYCTALNSGWPATLELSGVTCSDLPNLYAPPPTTTTPHP